MRGKPYGIPNRNIARRWTILPVEYSPVTRRSRPWPLIRLLPACLVTKATRNSGLRSLRAIYFRV